MPLFNMAKNKKVAKIPDDGKPLPEEPEVERPGTAGTTGTEMMLTTNRRNASHQYQAAQRAENTYKAKKRSAGARQHGSNAKSHFRKSAHHLKECVKSFGSMIGSIPWMFRGWQESRREAEQKKSKERDLKKKKKLEEKLAKSEADAESEKDA
jgi:hypothetical protein